MDDSSDDDSSVAVGGAGDDEAGRGDDGGAADDGGSQGERGDDDGGVGEDDLAYLIGQGRFVAASKLAARRSGVDRATSRAGSGGRRVLARVARAVDRRHRLLQVVAGAVAAVSAIAIFVSIFVAEIPVGDEVTGAPRSATVWSAGLRTAAGGSYGLILAVVAPAALAATLLGGRWWRPTLLAVTVHSLHWLESISDMVRYRRELELFESAVMTWRLVGHVALGVALVLGCVVLVTSPAGRSGPRPLYREIVSVASGLVLWAITWGRAQMLFESSGSEQRSETFGQLHRLPLGDLDRITTFPLDYLVGYLPAVLVAAASVSMFLAGGRGRPDLRVGVWIGLAVGVLADVVQRIPVWYDDPQGLVGGSGYPYLVTELAGRWTPALAPLLLLLASAIAFVSAAWIARTATEPADEDPLGPPLEVVDLDASPLWGERP